jgi:hypothetical protein
LDENISHQQSPVGGAQDAQVVRGRDAPADKVFRHGDEIVICGLSVLFEGRLMPEGAKLTPAANVGLDIDSPIFEPSRTDRGIVG